MESHLSLGGTPVPFASLGTHASFLFQCVVNPPIPEKRAVVVSTKCGSLAMGKGGTGGGELAKQEAGVGVPRGNQLLRLVKVVMDSPFPEVPLLRSLALPCSPLELF